TPAPENPKPSSVTAEPAFPPINPAITAVEAGAINSPPSTINPSNDFRILGVLGKLYVLMENASGLVLVDQHAAHERILFEEMRTRMEQTGVPAQRLLLPLTLAVTPRDADWIERHLDLLHRAGIGLEPFGAG